MIVHVLKKHGTQNEKCVCVRLFKQNVVESSYLNVEQSLNPSHTSTCRLYTGL